MHRTSAPLPVAYSARATPFEAVEAAFLELARSATPLTLPGHLLRASAPSGEVAIDRMRGRLAHPSTTVEDRARIWAEVVRRAQKFAEPWSTAALGMMMPRMRRLLVRVPRHGCVDRCEIEQEMLAELTEELCVVDWRDPELERCLARAVDRARHRVLYAAARSARAVSVDCFDDVEDLARGLVPDVADAFAAEDAGDEYGLLVMAVHEHVVTLQEAQLVARSRLGGTPMRDLVGGPGRSLRQLYRQRQDAEQRLAEWLRARSAVAQDDGTLSHL
ncbi:hypothetical protein ACFQVC_21420 [Streptomyces monticola]|uniref:Uncharacterized protein n=1 Tax=Streptomyces monticola TaxID=2666263 RepID=A0ABW2JLL4_9ACTN